MAFFASAIKPNIVAHFIPLIEVVLLGPPYLVLLLVALHFGLVLCNENRDAVVDLPEHPDGFLCGEVLFRELLLVVV